MKLDEGYISICYTLDEIILSGILNQEKYELQGKNVMHEHSHHGVIYKSDKLKLSAIAKCSRKPQ